MSKVHNEMVANIPVGQIIETTDKRFLTPDDVTNFSHSNIDVLKLLSEVSGKLQYNGADVGHTHSNTAVLDLLSEQDGILKFNGSDISSEPKAAEIPIEDVDGLFASLTDKNVESVLKYLFTLASNGKDLIAASITGKGIAAYDSDTFEVLAQKIDSILSSMTSATQSISFSVIAPNTQNIVLTKSTPKDKLCTSLLEYIHETGVEKYKCDFDNDDASNFNYDNNKVTFDGKLHCVTQHIYPAVVTDDTFESDYIYTSDFQEITNIEVTDNEVIVTGTPQPQVIKSNDIDLTGIESLDSIVLSASSTNSSQVLLALSFDGGVNWVAYNGTYWGAVNVDDPNHFKTTGMAKAVTDSLDTVCLEDGRNGSNTIKFAYYIDQNSVDDIAEVDKISINITMPEYYEICDLSKYNLSYDVSTGIISYTFFQNGTYVVNYND